MSYFRSGLIHSILVPLSMLATGNVAADPFTNSQPISNESLSQVAGGADIGQAILAFNTSNVSNNSVNGTSVTGGITIDGQAFQNLNGLAVVNANTGNNVSINSSMNVNVSTSP